MKARISLLHKSEAEWLRLSDFIPASGELIIYDPDDNFSYARIKIGDGVHTLSDLDFFVDVTARAIAKEIQYAKVFDSGSITEYLN